MRRSQSLLTFAAVAWACTVLLGTFIHWLFDLDDASLVSLVAVPLIALCVLPPVALLHVLPLLLVGRSVARGRALPAGTAGAAREPLFVVAITDLVTGAAVVAMNVSGAPWTTTAVVAGLLALLLVAVAVRAAAHMLALAHAAGQPGAEVVAADSLDRPRWYPSTPRRGPWRATPFMGAIPSASAAHFSMAVGAEL